MSFSQRLYHHVSEGAAKVNLQHPPLRAPSLCLPSKSYLFGLTWLICPLEVVGYGYESPLHGPGSLGSHQLTTALVFDMSYNPSENGANRDMNSADGASDSLPSLGSVLQS